VLGKELGIASRQRRYYLLRFGYVCLLMTVVVCLWAAILDFGGSFSPVVRASRLAEAGKGIVATIIWFQFVAGQVLAVALLSDAIGSEARRRTLDGILVAPMGGLYLVLGKLASRLLQIVLLLSLSLPLLAVVRVLGGVSWSYVVSGLCITLTAVLFAGSLSLLASTTSRKAYRAAALVGLWYVIIWGVLSGLPAYLSQMGYVNKVVTASVLFVANPFAALLGTTGAMLTGFGPGVASISWPLHCIVMLSAAVIVLALSVRRVYRVPSASGPYLADKSLRHVRAGWAGRRGCVGNRLHAQDAIRRVKGPPVAWKELPGFPLRSRRRVLFAVGVSVAFLFFVILLSIFFRGPVYTVLWGVIPGLQLAFVICLAVSTAGAITREKEARTWPVLLTTPLSNRQIIDGKAEGALQRNLPFLVQLLVLYLALLPSCPTSIDAGELFVFGVIGLAGTTVFLLGVGLYVSMRVGSTAAAVVWTLSLYFVPRLLYWSALGSSILMSGARGGTKLVGFVILSAMPAPVYVGIGLLCMRAATRRLRCNVFAEDVRWSLPR